MQGFSLRFVLTHSIFRAKSIFVKAKLLSSRYFRIFRDKSSISKPFEGR